MIVFAVIFFASIVAAFLGVLAFGLSSVQEQRSQQQLDAELRQLLRGYPVALSIGRRHPNGVPICWSLNVPAAGIRNVAVIEVMLFGHTLEGPGDLVQILLPGQGGVAVLVATSTTALGSLPARLSASMRKRRRHHGPGTGTRPLRFHRAGPVLWGHRRVGRSGPIPGRRCPRTSPAQQARAAS